MHFTKAFIRTVAALFAGTHIVLAGPGGWVALINATPYEWKLVHMHEYQMYWVPVESVSPGTSKESYYEFKQDHRDDAAEATYTLVGHPRNASFTLQARQSGGKHIEVQYHDGLRSLNNPENSLVSLHWEHDGAVAFILSGDDIDRPFISTNPPVTWMQATLPAIGSKSMREIAMPASHNSGASEMTRLYGGLPHNTITQSGNIYQQLINGARYFDIRPVARFSKWYTGHLTCSNLLHECIGGFGRTMENVIRDINQFTAEHPGELIILELSHDRDRYNSWSSLTSYRWQQLYAQLLGISDIWHAPNNLPQDLSTVPISTFIQPGSKSAVIFRIPNGAPLPETRIKSHNTQADIANEAINSTAKFDVGIEDADSTATAPAPASASANARLSTDPPHPLPTDLLKLSPVPKPAPSANPALHTSSSLGFFNERRLPQAGSFSDTEDVKHLATDQISKLSTLRASPKSEPLRSTWTITQGGWHALDIANKDHSILGEAAWAHRALFAKLWGAMTKERYPNLIEVDDVWNSQVAALCMAINDQFASGSEGKKVARGKVGRLERRERRV